MQIEGAEGEFGELRDAAGQGQPRDRMAAQVFQRSTHKVSHVEAIGFLQPVPFARCPLRRRTGRRDDMGPSPGGGHINAALD